MYKQKANIPGQLTFCVELIQIQILSREIKDKFSSPTFNNVSLFNVKIWNWIQNIILLTLSITWASKLDSTQNYKCSTKKAQMPNSICHFPSKCVVSQFQSENDDAHLHFSARSLFDRIERIKHGKNKLTKWQAVICINSWIGEM